MAKALRPVVKLLKMDLIDEPVGVIRLEIDQGEVEDLARSIEQVGLLQPIGVRKVGDRFEIVDGHRRYLAHKALKREVIACFVRAVDDLECALARATENLGRVNLSPIEEAAIYIDLLDTHGLTCDEIGKRMSKSPGVVKRRLDLLKMPPQLQTAVHIKAISYGVAEELWRLGDIGSIDYYLGYAIDHGVTVAVARQWVRDHRRSERTQKNDIEGGRGAYSPLESTPTYISCDLCQGPLDVREIVNIKLCPNCFEGTKEAVRGAVKSKGG